MVTRFTQIGQKNNRAWIREKQRNPWERFGIQN